MQLAQLKKHRFDEAMQLIDDSKKRQNRFKEAIMEGSGSLLGVDM
jgi:hypothetical protein